MTKAFRKRVQGMKIKANFKSSIQNISKYNSIQVQNTWISFVPQSWVNFLVLRMFHGFLSSMLSRRESSLLSLNGFLLFIDLLDHSKWNAPCFWQFRFWLKPGPDPRTLDNLSWILPRNNQPLGPQDNSGNQVRFRGVITFIETASSAGTGVVLWTENTIFLDFVGLYCFVLILFFSFFYVFIDPVLFKCKSDIAIATGFIKIQRVNWSRRKLICSIVKLRVTSYMIGNRMFTDA